MGDGGWGMGNGEWGMGNWEVEKVARGELGDNGKDLLQDSHSNHLCHLVPCFPSSSPLPILRLRSVQVPYSLFPI